MCTSMFNKRLLAKLVAEIFVKNEIEEICRPKISIKKRENESGEAEVLAVYCKKCKKV